MPDAPADPNTPPVVPVTPPAPPASPTTLKVGDVEYTPEKIAEMQEEMEAYKRDFTATSALIAGNTSDEERQQAIHNILLARGHSEEQIAAYFNNQGKPNVPDPEDPQLPEIPSELDNRLKGLEEATAASQQRQARERMDSLRMGLDSALERSLDRSEDMGVFFKDVQKIYNEQELKELKETLREDLRRHILLAAKEINRKKGEFYLSDFEEAAKTARAEVIKNARKVIPASLIGRMAATVSGPNASAFKTMKPPAKPEFKSGKSIGDVMTQTSAFNAYELTKIASEIEAESGTV